MILGVSAEQEELRGDATYHREHLATRIGL
jgi:hypothetical protein